MSKITVAELEVQYHVGVTDEERAKPQRLLVTVEFNFDFSTAAISDRLERTINYYDVAQDLLKFGDGRSWKLLEKLATNIAETMMVKYRPQAVQVEVKKFTIPQAKYVSVSVTRSRPK